MTTFDACSVAKCIEKYVGDEQFVNDHSLEEIAKVLDSAELSVEQDIILFNNLSRKFDPKQMFELLQHNSVNFGKDIVQVRRLLNTLGQKMNVTFFTCLSAFLQFFIQNGIKDPSHVEEINILKRDLSKINEEHKFKDIIISTLRYENSELKKQLNKLSKECTEPCSNVNKNPNIEALLQCSITKENFEKIYKILAKAANEDDIETIKFAIVNGYHEVRDSGDQNQNILVESGYIRTNNFKLAKMLVDNGADPSSRDDAGQTALYCFCTNGNLEAVKYLSNLPNVDVNSPKHTGTTTLMISCALNNYEIVNFLLSQPVIQVNVKNRDGYTAYKRAISNKIRELLIAHGAEQ